MVEEERKGLTPAGIAVVVVTSVGLIALPLLFWAFKSLSPPYFYMGGSTTITLPDADVDLKRTFKRVGKDVHVHVVIDNSRSAIQVQDVLLKMTMEGAPPVKPTGSIPVIAAKAKKAVDLVFKNVPKGNAKFDISVDYGYPSATSGTGGGYSDAGIQSVP